MGSILLLCVLKKNAKGKGVQKSGGLLNEEQTTWGLPWRGSSYPAQRPRPLGGII